MARSQAELPPRRMADSMDSASIPLGSDPQLRDRSSILAITLPRYLTVGGGVRIGRILEDMDIFAVHLVFKHVSNPRQGPGLASPLSIVTAMVDSIDFTRPLRSPAPHTISSGPTVTSACLATCPGLEAPLLRWPRFGPSNLQTPLQVSLELEQEVEGVWLRCTEATFVMVARDPLNKTANFVNPLKVVTKEEQEVFNRGIENKTRCVD